MLIITEGKLGEGMMLKPTISGPQHKEAATVPAVPSVEALPELCPSCGFTLAKVENGDEAAFYPVICPKCGFDTDKTIFCESCGYPCAALNQQDGE